VHYQKISNALNTVHLINISQKKYVCSWRLNTLNSQHMAPPIRLRHFKSDWDKIWQDCSSSECASIDGVGFLIWHHSFKTEST